MYSIEIFLQCMPYNADISKNGISILNVTI